MEPFSPWSENGAHSTGLRDIAGVVTQHLEIDCYHHAGDQINIATHEGYERAVSMASKRIYVQTAINLYSGG